MSSKKIIELAKKAEFSPISASGTNDIRISRTRTVRTSLGDFDSFLYDINTDKGVERACGIAIQDKKERIQLEYDIVLFDDFGESYESLRVFPLPRNHKVYSHTNESDSERIKNKDIEKFLAIMQEVLDSYKSP